VRFSDVSTLGLQPALRRSNVRAMIGVRILISLQDKRATGVPEAMRIYYLGNEYLVNLCIERGAERSCDGTCNPIPPNQS
jgi:hypothetical protein